MNIHMFHWFWQRNIIRIAIFAETITYTTIGGNSESLHTIQKILIQYIYTDTEPDCVCLNELFLRISSKANECKNPLHIGQKEFVNVLSSNGFPNVACIRNVIGNDAQACEILFSALKFNLFQASQFRQCIQGNILCFICLLYIHFIIYKSQQKNV